MERDLQIHTEDVDRLRAEVAYVAEYFLRLGNEHADMLFGFAWRTSADEPELSWRSVQTRLIDLDAEIRKAEDAGLGNFARDDVWLSFADRALKIQFCHHSGIHLSYDTPDDVSEHFFLRWLTVGLKPLEFEKNSDPPKWRCVRGEPSNGTATSE